MSRTSSKPKIFSMSQDVCTYSAENASQNIAKPLYKMEMPKFSYVPLIIAINKLTWVTSKYCLANNRILLINIRSKGILLMITSKNIWYKNRSMSWNIKIVGKLIKNPRYSINEKYTITEIIRGHSSRKAISNIS